MSVLLSRRIGGTLSSLAIYTYYTRPPAARYAETWLSRRHECCPATNTAGTQSHTKCMSSGPQPIGDAGNGIEERDRCGKTSSRTEKIHHAVLVPGAPSGSVLVPLLPSPSLRRFMPIKVVMSRSACPSLSLCPPTTVLGARVGKPVDCYGLSTMSHVSRHVHLVTPRR